MHLVKDVDIIQKVFLDVDLLQVEEIAWKLLYHTQIVELPIGEGDDVRVSLVLQHEVLDDLLVHSRLAVDLLVVTRGVLLGLLLAPVIVEFVRASRRVRPSPPETVLSVLLAPTMLARFSVDLLVTFVVSPALL